MPPEAFTAVADWIREHTDEMVQLQSALTAIPALAPENGGNGEWAKARYLESYLVEHGLDNIEHIDCPDDRVPEGSRPNLVVTIPGTDDSRSYGVLAHMDIVPPGEQNEDGSWKGWETDPYTLHQAGDMLVGRGVTDDQQGIVSAVFAARALKACGVQPAHTVKLLFVSDEETHSFFGIKYVLATAPDLISPTDAIFVPDAGSPDSTEVEIAEKSALWIEFRIKGRQAHASRPDLAVNAFRAGSRLAYLIDKELHRQFDKMNHLFDPPYSTFEPTRHDANVPNVNTIPGEDVFYFDCRVLPSTKLDDVLDLARAQCIYVDGKMDTETEMRVAMRADAAPPTPYDTPAVQVLTPAIERVYGVQPRAIGIGGQTVAECFRTRGLPAVAWMSTTETAHQANEMCSIKHMVGDAQVFAEVFATPLPG